MIVEVRLAVTTDDGLPLVLAERRVLVVQTPGDLDANASKGLVVMGDLVTDGLDDVKRQVRAYRELPAPEGS